MCLDTRTGQITRFRPDGREPKGQHDGICYACNLDPGLFSAIPETKVNRTLQGTCA